MFMIAATEAVKIADFSPIAGVLTFAMGCLTLIILGAMFKNFISQGISWAYSEWLLNHGNKEMRESVLKWFVNGDKIMERLEMIDEKISKNEYKN